MRPPYWPTALARFFDDGLVPSAQHESLAPLDAAPRRAFRGESMYVELLQDMICTVLAGESHLFTPREQATLSAFFALPYDARYLFSRLLQRKRDQWYRLDKLEYHDDVQDLAQAAHDLCRPFAAPLSPSSQSMATEEAELYRFAMMDAEIDGGLRARLELLTVDELKAVARQLGHRVRPPTRAALVAALLAKPTNATLCFCADELRLQTQPTSERLERAITALMQGGCLRLVPATAHLLDRVALVYYRGRPAMGSILTSAILQRTRKCHFPSYTVQRTQDLFPDREHLVSFERACAAAEQADQFAETWRMQLDAARACAQLVKTYEAAWQASLRQVRSLWPEGVPSAQYARMRFHAGWPLTRVLFKGCEALARLKRHEQEASVLQQLLTQRYFWRGRRGAWYERLSILTARQGRMDEALRLCLEALNDPDTPYAYMARLQRRVERLESQLQLPLPARHFFARLQSPTVVSWKGVRWIETPSVTSASALRHEAPDAKRPAQVRTRWQAANGGACSVEELCLERYAQQGFRGFHDEGDLVFFLFVLLLWDVLFATVPGAFETPFQRAPLDVDTDVFSFARRPAMERQLARIEQTGGLDIIQSVDARERPRQTYAQGCRWAEFSTDVLQEVALCLGGRALAALCRVMCEEGGGRPRGFPDLILWRYSEKQVQFVEVKSPNDRLSEAQKVWMDALLRAGIHVELAKVQDV